MGIKDFFGKIFQGVKKAASWVVDTGKNIFNKGAQAVKDVFSWGGQQVSKVVDAVVAVPGAIIGTANNLISTVGNITKQGISTVGTLGNNLITTTGGVVDKGFNTVGQVVTSVGSILTSPIFLIGGGIAAFFVIQMIMKK
jgi:hypothetical protein